MTRRNARAPYKVHWVDLPAKAAPPSRPVELDANGIPAEIVCADGTKRHVSKTGMEGALAAACKQVKVSLVPVIEPREVAHCRDNGDEIDQDTAAAQFRRLTDPIPKIEERREAEDGSGVKHADFAATYSEVVKRYGRRTRDVCERIPGSGQP